LPWEISCCQTAHSVIGCCAMTSCDRCWQRFTKEQIGIIHRGTRVVYDAWFV